MRTPGGVPETTRLYDP